MIECFLTTGGWDIYLQCDRCEIMTYLGNCHHVAATFNVGIWMPQYLPSRWQEARRQDGSVRHLCHACRNPHVRPCRWVGPPIMTTRHHQ